jgi:signal transduction histidine kinase
MHALMAKPNSAETPEIELTTRELDTVSKKTREIIDKLQELEQIPIVECIATCVNTLEEFASKSKFPVILKELTVADNAVVSQKFSHHIELILREVLHNTQKYALPQAQEIAIKSSEGLLVIDINEINNFKNPLPLKEGSGITSIKSRAMDLHGTIEFYYSEGLCIRVSAPLHHQ